ncbi:RNA-binding motif protein, X-linked 2 [Pelomyxa schiedti]|nr:RNA-binding motif protein, X-linked 2 [Pelomyxa schiedti]
MSSRSRSRSRSRSYSGSPQRRRSPIRGTSRERMHSRCLFVGNLPYSFKERDLTDLFERCGAVKNVTLGFNKQTGQSKCYAFVEFEDRRDAADAISKYNGYDIEGRRLRIDWDIGLQTKMQYYGVRRRVDNNRRPRSRSRSYSSRSRSRSWSRSNSRSRSRSSRSKHRSRSSHRRHSSRHHSRSDRKRSISKSPAKADPPSITIPPLDTKGTPSVPNPDPSVTVVAGMGIYSVLVFNKSGKCVYHEDMAPGGIPNTSDTRQHYQATMMGMLHTMRQLCAKLSNNHDERLALRCYRTTTYKLHYYESPTGVKFIALTDPNVPPLYDHLSAIYRDVYIEYVIKNPLYKLDADTIKCVLFQQQLRDYLAKNHIL